MKVWVMGWGAMRGVVGWNMWCMVWRVECKWIQAMEPVMFRGPWGGNAQHLMFFMHPFGLAGHAEVIVWAYYALEAHSKNVLVAAVTDYTRVSWAGLV